MEKTEEKKFVMPGEEIAPLEEFLPGSGTYEDDGIVYSEYAGYLHINRIEKIAEVKPIKRTGDLRKGDIVYGIVKDIKPMMAIVEAVEIEGESREIAGDTHGTLHISKISTKYVSEIDKILRISDTVRAVVMSGKPALQLSTARPDLGVILALCKKCRKPMTKRGRKLYCEDCEITDDRPVSRVYGQYVMPSERK